MLSRKILLVKNKERKKHCFLVRYGGLKGLRPKAQIERFYIPNLDGQIPYLSHHPASILAFAIHTIKLKIIISKATLHNRAIHPKCLSDFKEFSQINSCNFLSSDFGIEMRLELLLQRMKKASHFL